MCQDLVTVLHTGARGEVPRRPVLDVHTGGCTSYAYERELRDGVGLTYTFLLGDVKILKGAAMYHRPSSECHRQLASFTSDSRSPNTIPAQCNPSIARTIKPFVAPLAYTLTSIPSQVAHTVPRARSQLRTPFRRVVSRLHHKLVRDRLHQFHVLRINNMRLCWQNGSPLHDIVLLALGMCLPRFHFPPVAPLEVVLIAS